MIDFKHIKEHIYDRKTERNLLLKQNDKTVFDLKELDIELRDSQKALGIIQIVAKTTQNNLSYRISELCSLSLDAIFEDKYKFKIDFVEKNNRISCSMYLIDKNKNEIDPMSACGGGLIDIVAFALRLTIHSIQVNSTRSLFILDEGFKHLSIDLQNKMSKLLKELSEKLNIQFIIVSHCTEILEYADNKILIGNPPTADELTLIDDPFTMHKVYFPKSMRYGELPASDVEFIKQQVKDDYDEKEKR